MYKSLVKPLLFNLDAERAHHLVFDNLRRAARVPGTKALLRACTISSILSWRGRFSG